MSLMKILALANGTDFQAALGNIIAETDALKRDREGFKRAVPGVIAAHDRRLANIENTLLAMAAVLGRIAAAVDVSADAMQDELAADPGGLNGVNEHERHDTGD